MPNETEKPKRVKVDTIWRDMFQEYEITSQNFDELFAVAQARYFAASYIQNPDFFAKQTFLTKTTRHFEQQRQANNPLFDARTLHQVLIKLNGIEATLKSYIVVSLQESEAEKTLRTLVAPKIVKREPQILTPQTVTIDKNNGTILLQWLQQDGLHITLTILLANPIVSQNVKKRAQLIKTANLKIEGFYHPQDLSHEVTDQMIIDVLAASNINSNMF